MDTWILQMCRAKYRNQVVAWGLTVGLCVLIGFANRRYIGNFVRGPFTMSAAELEQVGDVSAAPHYFVKVAGSRAMETGLQEVSVETQNGVETSRNVTGNYYALQMGDKLLVVKSTGATMRVAEGALAPMPFDLTEKLFATPEMQLARSRFYPFYLDAASTFRAGGYWGIIVLAVLLALLAWKARPAWRGLQEPGSHPLAVRAGKWGSAVDTSAAIEHEWRAPGNKRMGPWTVTPRYLIQSALFHFNVLRFEDLLWAYKKVTKRSVNFIPVGKYYHAIVQAYGGTAELPGSQKKVDELLQDVATRAPWAVVGFSAEIQQLWTKQNRDFCAAVEERRQKLRATP
jgi:hypothetical protein